MAGDRSMSERLYGDGCQHCGASTQLYLCAGCVVQLQAMLEELPWLLEQLAVTVQRRDRLNTGAVGKGTGNPSPINFGAMETARDLEKLLTRIVDALCSKLGLKFLPALAVPGDFIGPLRFGWRRLPAGFSGSPVQRARWLLHHVRDIARHPDAAEFYGEIAEQLEDDEIGRAGPMWKAINRTERLFAGLCPTVTGRDRRGRSIECETALYADRGELFARCPKCEATVDVKKNRLKAAVDRDLLPEPKLLEVLADLGQKVSRVRLYEWLKAGRLQPRGFVHNGRIVSYRIRRGDPRVFSLSQARQLQMHDEQLKQQKAGAH